MPLLRPGRARRPGAARRAGDDIRYVWRHLPLEHVHPHADFAAEAAEAAAEQGAFWEMHDLLLDHQDHLPSRDLLGYAEQLGLDVDRFRRDLKEHRLAARVAEDVQSAELSGVSGTPTFFVNGRRHYGAYDIDTLKAAVKTAKARAAVEARPPRRRRRHRAGRGDSPASGSAQDVRQLPVLAVHGGVEERLDHLVPDLGVLRLEHPVVLVGEVQELVRHALGALSVLPLRELGPQPQPSPIGTR